MVTKEITTAQLLTVLLGTNNKSTFANVLYVTNESKSKTVNKMKAIQKMVKVNISLNFEYDKKVQRLLDKQGLDVNFVGVGNWHESLFDGNRTLLTDKKTRSKFYLRYAQESNTKPNVTLYHNSKVIDRKQAEKLDLFTKSYYNKPETVGRGLVSTENNFYFRVLEIKKITEIKINGIRYIHKDFVDVR